MDTSGLLIIAKNKQTYLHLQRQFAAHTVRKRYVALLSGVFNGVPSGIISLPLIADPLDRPYQKVDMENGVECTIGKNNTKGFISPFEMGRDFAAKDCPHRTSMAGFKNMVALALQGKLTDSTSTKQTQTSTSLDFPFAIDRHIAFVMTHLFV